MTGRTGLIDQAVAELRGRIASGEWTVGTRIPTEPALAELLGVGRNTVREAVQSLVHAGLLDRRQGSGTYVLGDSELGVALARQIAQAHHRHVLEVRRSLEVEAARLAAARRSPQDAETLRGLNRSRALAFESPHDVEAMVVTDLALHRAIAVAARNPVLLSLYESLLDAIGETIRTNVLTDHRAHTHDALVEAIVAGDADRAARESTTYLGEFLTEEERAVTSHDESRTVRSGR